MRREGSLRFSKDTVPKFHRNLESCASQSEQLNAGTGVKLELCSVRTFSGMLDSESIVYSERVFIGYVEICLCFPAL
jgi:hypothetical protein